MMYYICITQKIKPLAYEYRIPVPVFFITRSFALSLPKYLGLKDIVAL